MNKLKWVLGIVAIVLILSAGGFVVWAGGGHSLGGSMAANYANRHREAMRGLVLWASYPAGSDKLSAAAFAVAFIYASNDGLATGDKIEKSRALLPADTAWVKIEGGNHAQFGWYGVQAGDGTATLSRAAQQDQTVRATLDLMRRVDSR